MPKVNSFMRLLDSLAVSVRTELTPKSQAEVSAISPESSFGQEAKPFRQLVLS